MKCHYPNCHHPALWTPVIQLPTVRSVGNEKAMVVTKQPTTLLCREVCQHHRDSYNLADWISLADWKLLQELALKNNFHIPEITVIVVQFKPLGWTPKKSLELERS